MLKPDTARSVMGLECTTGVATVICTGRYQTRQYLDFDQQGPETKSKVRSKILQKEG